MSIGKPPSLLIPNLKFYAFISIIQVNLFYPLNSSPYGKSCFNSFNFRPSVDHLGNFSFGVHPFLAKTHGNLEKGSLYPFPFSAYDHGFRANYHPHVQRLGMEYLDHCHLSGLGSLSKRNSLYACPWLMDKNPPKS